MNIYLVMLGSQVDKIREIMNWTQGDLCDSVGISRGLLSNIERDPSKLTKTVALALFTSVFGEIQKRRLEIEKVIEQTNWSNAEELKSSFGSVSWGKTDLVTLVAIAHGAAISQSPAILGGLSAISSTISNPLAYFLVTFMTNLSKNPLDKKDSKTEFKDAVASALDHKEVEICKCFGIKKPNMDVFVKLIKQGESS